MSIAIECIHTRNFHLKRIGSIMYWLKDIALGVILLIFCLNQIIEIV